MGRASEQDCGLPSPPIVETKHVVSLCTLQSVCMYGRIVIVVAVVVVVEEEKEEEKEKEEEEEQLRQKLTTPTSRVGAKLICFLIFSFGGGDKKGMAVTELIFPSVRTVISCHFACRRPAR